MKKILGLGILLLLFTAYANRSVKYAARPYVFDSLADIKPKQVALVLGTSPVLKNGKTNLYFQYRMEAAQKLFQRGKVKHFILSGDNHSKNYDEPEAMRQALIKLGVPDSVMTLDYAGFRTFDSVLRSKVVFGQHSVLIVSQKFHNERAVYLARQKGMEATGYNAAMPQNYGGFKTLLRETFARVKAVLDVTILRTKPKFYGEPIVLPGT